MIVWTPVQLADVPRIVAFTSRHYLQELAGVLTVDLDRLCESIAHDVLRRNFNAGTAMIQQAHIADRLVGWHWISLGSGTDYIQEATAEAHMLHIDLTLPARTRVRMITDTLQAWENWCRILEIPVLVSTTIRRDWQPFMELHRRRGYEVRGSHAFKRITKEQQ